MAERKISFNNPPINEQPARVKRSLHVKTSWWSPVVEARLKIDDAREALKKYRSGAPVAHATPVTEINPITYGTPPENVKKAPVQEVEQPSRPDPAVVERARVIIGDTTELSQAQRIVLTRLLAIAEEGREPTPTEYGGLEYICAQWEPRPAAYPSQGIDNLINSAKRRLGEHGDLVIGSFADLDGNLLPPDEKRPQINLSALNTKRDEVELVAFSDTSESSSQEVPTDASKPRERGKHRTPEQTAVDKKRVRALLGTGQTDIQIAWQLNLTHSQVRYARRRLELDEVKKLFEAAEVMGSPLSGQEAALQGAKKEFGRQLDKLNAQLEECTYGKYGPDYTKKAKELTAEIQRIKGDPFYTGVINALRRMPVSDMPTNTEPAQAGGVHLGQNEPPRYRESSRGNDTGPGQGRMNFSQKEYPLYYRQPQKPDTFDGR